MGGAVETLMSGEVRVDYGQMYVLSDPENDGGGDLVAAFAGQEAGLCGAAVPGSLFLVTALHTGIVGLTVELHDDPPPLDPLWEEVVEVSFRPLSSRTSFVEWGGRAWRGLDLEQICHRVRYSARGMAEASIPNSWEPRRTEEPVDHYLLQFWPCSPASPARIVKRTTTRAASWHDWAGELPPPPIPKEVAEAERLAELERERERERERVETVVREWGGRMPSDRLRAVDGDVSGMVDLDVHLLHELDAAGPDVQRAVARLAARRACTVAGLAALDWVAPTLEALDRGGELPPPFDEPDRVSRLLSTDERVPLTVVNPTWHRTGISPPRMAVRAVFAAAEPDPLHAVIDALFAAAVTYDVDYGTFFDEVRSHVELGRRRAGEVGGRTEGRDSRHV